MKLSKDISVLLLTMSSFSILVAMFQYIFAANGLQPNVIIFASNFFISMCYVSIIRWAMQIEGVYSGPKRYRSTRKSVYWAAIIFVVINIVICFDNPQKIVIAGTLFFSITGVLCYLFGNRHKGFFWVSFE